MASSKTRVAICGLFILLSACAKRTLIGHYYDYKEVSRSAVIRELALNKDSTFTFKESFDFTLLGDVHNPPRSFIGKGRYSVNGKSLTLIFNSRIRKVNKIEVIPISEDSISKIMGQTIHMTDSGSCMILYQVDANSYYYDRDSFPTAIAANNELIFRQAIIAGTYQEEFIRYNKSAFPLEIELDFQKLAGRFGVRMSSQDYIDYRSITETPKSYKNYSLWNWPDPGYNSGFFDEKVSISKPGNYLVKLFLYKPYDGRAQEQVITGKRIYEVKHSFFGIRIGRMKRGKKTPQIRYHDPDYSLGHP